MYLSEAKYESQFNDPVQSAIIGEHNTINIYQSSKESTGRQNGRDTPSPVWNVPYRRNPFFTGREALLDELYNKFQTSSAVALTQSQAITGLGGIGKTQIAIEYAYLHGEKYRDVLWVKAASSDTLVTDFTALAALLHLPEQNEQDQDVIVMAIKRWLATHNDWLLVMDNVDDLNAIYNFLPTLERSNGHILLTTRAFATGQMATSIVIEKMTEEEGTTLLLRRSGVLVPTTPTSEITEAERVGTKSIYLELDGLPLALDQAGAYIEETGCGLSGYLELYRTQRIALLRERGSFSFDHPESVATTFSLNFQRLQEASSQAAELLRLCAFLHPDAIPDAIFTDYVPHLDPDLRPIVANQVELNAVVRLLFKFSLVRRNPDTKTLTIHRLVQATLKDEMDQQTQSQWAEYAVRSVSRSFPFASPETLNACQSYLPHAYVCEKLIEQWQIDRMESAGLLYRTGRYFRVRARYNEAEPFYQKALIICEKVKGLENLGVASILSSLAKLYQEQGKYAQAESFYKQALKIRKRDLRPEDSTIAINLKDLGGLYQQQGKYAQAESFYKQALKIQKKALGARHHEVGVILNDLGILYQAQGKYAAAETNYQQSLEIKAQEPETVNLSSVLSNLANAYNAQGRYAEAEPIARRALTIIERILGPEHPDVATRCVNLGALCFSQHKFTEAEELYLRALAICEQTLGPDHPAVANILNNLVPIYRAKGNYGQIELLVKRALDINERVFGPAHPRVALTLSNLGVYYHDQGKYIQAEQFYQQALTIWDQTQGLEIPNLINTLRSYANLLRKMEQETKAKEVEKRAWILERRNIQENQKFMIENQNSSRSSKISSDRRAKKGDRHGKVKHGTSRH